MINPAGSSILFGGFQFALDQFPEFGQFRIAIPTIGARVVGFCVSNTDLVKSGWYLRAVLVDILGSTTGLGGADL